MQKYSAWALGGIDSAVTALLYSDAIGKKNTKRLFLPDYATPDLDIKYQGLFVKKFDLLCEKKTLPLLFKLWKASAL